MNSLLVFLIILHIYIIYANTTLDTFVEKRTMKMTHFIKGKETFKFDIIILEHVFTIKGTYACFSFEIHFYLILQAILVSNK